jgi:invasion protein IalB
MAKCTLQVARGGAIGYAGAAALALSLGMASLIGSAAAQQPPPAPAPKKAAPAAPAPKGAAAAAAPAAPQSAWVKVCEKATAVTKNKEGKEENKDLNICVTIHERIDGNNGMVVLSVGVRQIEGQDKQVFMVMVPLGMMIPAGVGAAIYPKDLWEKATKNETVDESKLKRFKMAYLLCHPAGCTAEVEAAPELLNDLKASGGLAIYAINPGGQTVAFPVALSGFDQAYVGAPVDNKQYSDARKALAQQIAQRQQEAYEAYKKQEEAKKTGPDPAAPPPKK